MNTLIPPPKSVRDSPLKTSHRKPTDSSKKYPYSPSVKPPDLESKIPDNLSIDERQSNMPTMRMEQSQYGDTLKPLQDIISEYSYKLKTSKKYTGFAICFHLTFKFIALFSYMLLRRIVINWGIIYESILLFSAIDLWVDKNVCGR